MDEMSLVYDAYQLRENAQISRDINILEKYSKS